MIVVQHNIDIRKQSRLTTQSWSMTVKANRWLSTLFIAIFVLTNSQLKAQDRIELGGFLGTSYYMGDLNPGTPFKNSHLAVGAIARYVLNDRWAVKGAYTMGTISGSYPGEGLTYPATSNQGYAFSRKINDIAAMAEFNFLSYDHQFLSKTVFTPYIAVGLATTMYSRYDIESPSSNGSTVFILSLPFGVGVKYKLTDWVRIGAEWTLRKTFVDDLDYTGGTTPIDPTDPYGFGTSHTVHNNDWYSFAGVTLTFNMLHRKTTCKSGF